MKKLRGHVDCAVFAILSFSLKTLQIFLMLIADTKAFPCLLYGFVMSPHIKSVFLDNPDTVFILLRQCRGKIPCSHHIYVVLTALYVHGNIKLFRTEFIVQKICHQHAEPESDRIGFV